MKRPRNIPSARDMIAAAKLAESFVKGMTKRPFAKDLKTQAAICRQLEIIGEAATRMSREFRESAPAIPWKRIIGMRNILIHMYEEVDEDQLWQTIKKDLPKLILELKRLIAKDG